jgi:hypothetical protein
MWWPPALDALVVLVFVAVGRETHNEGNEFAAFVETAAPFLVGWAIGWLVARARFAPRSAATGLTVWIATLVVGMTLRRGVFDEGTALSFIIVATVFLGAGMLGWRSILARLTTRAG